MAGARRTAVLGSLLLVLAAGCGDGEKAPEPRDTASSAPVPSPTAETTAAEPSSPTAGVPPTQAPSTPTSATPGGTSCASDRLADGTWRGPLTLEMDAEGGENEFESSTGTGTLTLVVQDGRVTRGAWRATWTSHGEADTGQAAATIDVNGTLRGNARGTATKPVLPGRWSIAGSVELTKPQQVTQPFTDAGRVSRPLTVEQVTCDEAVGTFKPVFASKATAVRFAGTARWSGTRR